MKNYRFPGEMLEGQRLRDIYRDKLTKAAIHTNEGYIGMSNESIDDVTKQRFDDYNDLMIANPMYKALNDPSVSGSINGQILEMINRDREIGPVDQIEPYQMSDEEKAKQFKLKMFIEDLRKRQKLG